MRNISELSASPGSQLVNVTLLPQNDLLTSTHWFKKFNSKRFQETQNLAGISHEIHEMETQMETCTQLITRETLKRSQLKKEAGTLRVHFDKMESQLKQNEDVLRHVQPYLRWLIYILNHQDSTIPEIQNIVGQTQSLIKVTFNSLKGHLEDFDEELDLNEQDILKEKLLSVLQLSKGHLKDNGEVKEVTELLQNFLMDQGKRIKFFTILMPQETGGDNEKGQRPRAICAPINSQVQVTKDVTPNLRSGQKRQNWSKLRMESSSKEDSEEEEMTRKIPKKIFLRSQDTKPVRAETGVKKLVSGQSVTHRLIKIKKEKM